jgi:hypothetical protein
VAVPWFAGTDSSLRAAFWLVVGAEADGEVEVDGF